MRLVHLRQKGRGMSKPTENETELRKFLETLKIHNKDLDACFNDAVAVGHLEFLITSDKQRLLQGLITPTDKFLTWKQDDGSEEVYVPLSVIQNKLEGLS
jgi:hypothetical protein